MATKIKKKSASGGETHTVQTPDGVRKVKTSASSAKIMDRTVKRYAKALKRLADR